MILYRSQGALESGHRLLWYRIGRVLGHGTFGITYLAEDINLKKPVAIKEFFPNHYCSRKDDSAEIGTLPVDVAENYKWAMERFLSEARTLAKFEHPNIIRVLNVFEENGTAYMVMNYESGVSFADLLKQRRTLSEDELTKITKPLLDGLEKVHATGFIHRDIKPSNIYIRKDGTPVLLDFGSARQSIKEQTQDVTRLISPGYAPIEQYTNNSNLQGPWSDIYGIGATLYRAVTGQAPSSAVDRSEAIMNGEDDFVPSAELVSGTYSQGFLRAIDHALAYRAQDRPQDIATWRQEFDDYVYADAPTQPMDADATQPEEDEDDGDVATDQIDRRVGEVIDDWKKEQPSNQNEDVATEQIAQKVDKIIDDWKKDPRPNQKPASAEGWKRSPRQNQKPASAEERKNGLHPRQKPASTEASIPRRFSADGESPQPHSRSGRYPDSRVVRNSYTDKIRSEGEAGSAAAFNDLPTMVPLELQAGLLPEAEPENRRRHGIYRYVIKGSLAVAACGLVAMVLLTLMNDPAVLQQLKQFGAGSENNMEVAEESDRSAHSVPDQQPEAPRELAAEQTGALKQQLSETSQAQPENEATPAVNEPEVESITNIGRDTVVDLESTATTPRESQELQSGSPGTDMDRAQQQTDIEDQLVAARADLAARRLTTPPGNNAYDKYQSILEDDPDNQEAREGLQRILDLYLFIAFDAMARGNLRHADEMLQRAAKVNPQSPRLIQAHAKLRKQGDQIRTSSDSVSPAVHHNSEPSPPIPAGYERNGDRIVPSPPLPARDEANGDRTVPSPPLH